MVFGGTRRRGLTTLQCQRTATCFKHGGGKPEWGSPQNACILWGPRVGGGNQDNQRDEKPIRSVFEHDAHSERVSFCTPPRSRRGKSPPKRASAGHKAIKARGGEPLRACIDFENFVVVKGAKILARFASKIFRRNSLTKQAQRKKHHLMYTPSERCLNAMFLFRRRSNENPERDVA